MLPGAEVPAALAALGDLTEAQAVALSSDGTRAAIAVSSPRRDDRALVRVVTDLDRGPRVVEVRGEVRGLVFDEGSPELYALLHRPERRGPGQAFLARIDTQALRVLREVGLPPSARDLSIWESGGYLLVACQDEVRTFSIAELASGRLFLLPGENRTLAWLPGGDQLLVGQPDRLLLVDLSDPQAREGLAPREGLDTAVAFDRVAAAPDGTRAVAHAEDGTAWRIDLDPLSLQPSGEAIAVFWPGAADPDALRRPPPLPERREVPPPPPPDRSTVEERIPPPPPEPRAVPQAAPAAPIPTPRPKPPEPERAAPEPLEAEPAAQEPAPAPSLPREVTDPEPAAPEAPKSRPAEAKVWGRITGPAAGQVVAVLVLGPDSILREAARVAPGPDGVWSVPSLPPGTYRIQVDGGGTRALVSDPSFRIVKVVGEEPVSVPDIQVLRAL
jgi:hypothetical protein